MRGRLAFALVALLAIVGCKRCGGAPERPKEQHVAMTGCSYDALKVHPLFDATAVSFESTHFGFVTSDGLDTSIEQGLGEQLRRSESIAAISGRRDDLWIVLRSYVSPSSDVLPPQRLLRRRSGKWEAIVPISEDAIYGPPVPYRGGALSIVQQVGSGGAYRSKIVGVGLSEDVNAATLFPEDVWKLHGIDPGIIVADAKSGLYLLRPSDARAKPLALPSEGTRTLEGATLATFRVYFDRAAYRLEGDKLVRAQTDDDSFADAAAREGRESSVRAHDGEFFTKRETLEDGGPIAVLVRERRPKEVFTCSTEKPAQTAPAIDEPPLAWGKRPPKEAELYPALEGPCVGLELHALVDATFIHHDSELVARVTDDGFDFEVSRGLGEVWKKERQWPEYIVAVSGRADDLWVQAEGAGSVFREARLLRRRDGKWRTVAPLGHDKWHYTAPEPFRGGAVGFALPTEYSDADPVMLGFDLPKELPAKKTVPKGSDYSRMVALEDGTILATSSAASGAYLLGPTDLAPVKLKTDEGNLSIVGHSKKSLRVVSAKSRYRLEGRDLVHEEVEHVSEWRRNGSAVQRLVGAGYHDVDVGNRKVIAFDIAHDGEVFVIASADRDKYEDVVLYRSKRPRETFRCTEHGTFGDDYGPATKTGIEPWPPAADATCKTPFVVAFRYAETEKVPASFPKANAVLEPEGVTIEKVKSGTRFVAGAWTKDFTAATSVRDRLTKELKIKPEIVCATRSDPSGR